MRLQCVWSTPELPIPPGTVLTALPTLTGLRQQAYDAVVTLSAGRPGRGVSYRDVAERLACSPSTAHRLVAWLIEEGFVVSGPPIGRSGAAPPNTLRLVRF